MSPMPHNRPMRACTLEQRALLQRLHRNHPGLTALVIMVAPSVVTPASVVATRLSVRVVFVMTPL